MSADDGRVALVSQTTAPAAAPIPPAPRQPGWSTSSATAPRPSAGKGRPPLAPGRRPRPPAHRRRLHRQHRQRADFRLRPPAPRNTTSPVQPCDPLTGLPRRNAGRLVPSIRDIQGQGHVSPLRWELVIDVPGIVTAVSGNGFWMQDPCPTTTRPPRRASSSSRAAVPRCDPATRCWCRDRGGVPPWWGPGQPRHHRDHRAGGPGRRAQSPQLHHPDRHRSGWARPAHRDHR